MDRGRRGEGRGGKETDGCPLTKLKKGKVKVHNETSWQIK
jgi:hypothetical protein